MKKGYKIVLAAIVAVVIIAIVAVAGWVYKVYAYDPIGEGKVCVYITPAMSNDSLQRSLAQYVDETTARRIVELMGRVGYDEAQRAKRCGYYEMNGKLSVYKAARRLAVGSETPLRFTFNNIRTLDQLAARADEVLYFTADSLLSLLADAEVCARYGFDTTTIAAMFIPDTYEFYWTVSPQRFLERMHYYYKQYWNEERVALAEKAGLTPMEVSVLASIVEEETAKRDEMPIVAGLYINRLRRGIPLQADPTVKYAVGDFALQRILNKHLATESPYNTYLHTGLPPGPIRLPSQTALNAVLHYKQHNYIYMCAREDFSGYHNFARTLGEHNRNAARYHAALNSRRIR